MLRVIFFILYDIISATKVRHCGLVPAIQIADKTTRFIFLSFYDLILHENEVYLQVVNAS